VSYPSFVWAHCLVRSRALDLTFNPVCKNGSVEVTTQGPGGEAAGVSRVQCMLPIIDLCNHAAGGSCTLSLRESALGGRYVVVFHQIRGAFAPSFAMRLTSHKMKLRLCRMG